MYRYSSKAKARLSSLLFALFLLFSRGWRSPPAFFPTIFHWQASPAVCGRKVVPKKRTSKHKTINKSQQISNNQQATSKNLQPTTCSQHLADKTLQSATNNHLIINKQHLKGSKQQHVANNCLEFNRKSEFKLTFPSNAASQLFSVYCNWPNIICFDC